MLGCHQDLSEGFDESFTNFSVITSLTIYFLGFQVQKWCFFYAICETKTLPKWPKT